jgi:hypothetical protein
MTGIHYPDRVQSGPSNRPQIAFSRHADRRRAMSNLIAGLLGSGIRAEAGQEFRLPPL